jgi:hypothetical protein
MAADVYGFAGQQGQAGTAQDVRKPLLTKGVAGVLAVSWHPVFWLRAIAGQGMPLLHHSISSH